jgi:hypothetical protein
MKPFIPRRYEFPVFGFLLSGMMSFMVSGIATLINAGPVRAFPALWIASWLPAWSVAFPTLLVVAPLVRRALTRLVLPE